MAELVGGRIVLAVGRVSVETTLYAQRNNTKPYDKSQTCTVTLV